ncbi:MAG: transposase [Polyangiaceae bacterium]|nr:transposase [Polyangiaceae bacterium]
MPRPTEDEVYEVAARTAKKVKAILEKRGRTSDSESSGEEGSEIEPALGACYDVAARAPKKQVVDGPRVGKGACAVIVDGFNVYAGDAIDGRDRKRVERICRYLARPPIATERLTETGDGDELRYELKKAWKDGTRYVTLDPYGLMARICAMVPPPRFHMIRFHGVLAPNSALREQVVASAKPYVSLQENTVPNSVQLPLFGKLFDEPEVDVKHARRKPWAWLLRHVFAIDVNVCPKCAGRMKWREVALTADAIREGLARAGLSARGPPRRSRAPLGQLSLPFPKARHA